jgi:septum formation protein
MIILASKSHIRHQLLANAAVPHEVIPSPLDENAEKRIHLGAKTEDLASQLASAKSLALAPAYPERHILGADQTLEFEGRTIHKCETRDAARDLLLEMRGKSHMLHSALAVSKAGRIAFQHRSAVTLHMRNFTDAFLEHYLNMNTPDILDSVGCYNYETMGIQLFDRVEGDYHAILGLPLLPLLAFLRQIGELNT